VHLKSKAGPFDAVTAVPSCRSTNGLIAARLYVDRSQRAAAVVVIRSSNGSQPQAATGMNCLRHRVRADADRAGLFSYYFLGEDDYRDTMVLYVGATSPHLYRDVLDRFQDVELRPLGGQG
jgi:hypothetical protein